MKKQEILSKKAQVRNMINDLEEQRRGYQREQKKNHLNVIDELKRSFERAQRDHAAALRAENEAHADLMNEIDRSTRVRMNELKSELDALSLEVPED